MGNLRTVRGYKSPQGIIVKNYTRAKKETQTEKQKGAATTAAANIAEYVGSLFGSNKVKTLERENTALHREIADHEETIEVLQDRIQTMQVDHCREIREMQRRHGREIADKDTSRKYRF